MIDFNHPPRHPDGRPGLGAHAAPGPGAEPSQLGAVLKGAEAGDAECLAWVRHYLPQYASEHFPPARQRD